MIKYTITDGSPLDLKLYMAYSNRNCDDIWWHQFVRQLDANIIEVNYDGEGTNIIFNSEEDLTWFLLRWS